MAIELDDYLAAINSQRRVLMVLEIDRRARDVTQLSETIVEIFKQGAEQRARNEARALSNVADEGGT